MTYKKGDVVRFTTRFSNMPINGLIDEIKNDQYFVIDLSDDSEYTIKFQDIVELISKSEYSLGDYVIIDFISKEFACMICTKEETWDGYFYTIEVQNKKGEVIFFVDGLCNSHREVDYRILWDHERNEKS